MGGPEHNYEFLLGLYLNEDRQRMRTAYTILRGTRDARQQVEPEAYLIAEYESPEEAQAIHTLLLSRAGLLE